MKKRKILLNDVTLREESQVEGGMMSTDNQLKYVEYLIKGGIDIIEIGYPGSSPKQMAQCKKIVEYVRNHSAKKKPLLSGLAAGKKEMIDAVKEAGCDICHIYIPSSEELLSKLFSDEKYGDTDEERRQWALNKGGEMVKYARTLEFKYVEYSPEDAARTSFEYLCQVAESVITAGVNIINIPDTTGLQIGNEFGNLISRLQSALKNVFKKGRKKNGLRISVHCHNDSDHANHNALQGVLAGASQVEGSFYGLGERSGMTKFESLLMVIDARENVFKSIQVGFKRNLLVEIVNFIANALGMPVPRHWPVIGTQNKICSSGSHQAIEAKAKESGEKSPYYSWDPALYGHEKVEIVINCSSGRGGLKLKLKEQGITLTKDQLNKAFQRVKRVSDAKGSNLTDLEILAIVRDVITVIPFSIKVKDYKAIGGTRTAPAANIILEIDYQEIEAGGIGDGIFDALMKAVICAVGKKYPIVKDAKIVLVEWRPTPITRGTDAIADVHVRIEVNNGEKAIYSGQSADPDTALASAQAFANCLSWYLESVLK